MTTLHCHSDLSARPVRNPGCHALLAGNRASFADGPSPRGGRADVRLWARPTLRVARVALIVALVLSAAARVRADEAEDFATGPQEEAAYQAVKAIRPLDPLEQVRGLVVKFLDTYPDSKWRREARLRLMKACVANDSPRDAVDECMGITRDMPGSFLGDMVTRDSWSELASLLARSGRHSDAGRVRLLIFARFPYQLENRSALLLAMKEFAQAGQHQRVLAVGRLALIFVSENECKEALGLVKASLAAVKDPAAAEQFERYWRQGPGDPAGRQAGQDRANPLEAYELPEAECLARSASAALAGEGLLAEEPGTRAMQKALLLLLSEDLPSASQEYQKAVAASAPDQKDKAVYEAGAYFRFLDGHTVRAQRYRSYVLRGKAGPVQTTAAASAPTNPFLDPPGSGSH
jgi:hypothetical protein